MGSEKVLASGTSGALLDDVCQLVSEQSLAFWRHRVKPTRPKHDVMADRVGLRPDRTRRLARMVVGMDPNGTEVGAQAALHDRPKRRVKGLSVACQDLGHGRRRNPCKRLAHHELCGSIVFAMRCVTLVQATAYRRGRLTDSLDGILVGIRCFRHCSSSDPEQHDSRTPSLSRHLDITPNPTCRGNAGGADRGKLLLHR